jgi:hypothetical protein
MSGTNLPLAEESDNPDNAMPAVILEIKPIIYQKSFGSMYGHRDEIDEEIPSLGEYSEVKPMREYHTEVRISPFSENIYAVSNG